MDRKGSLEAFVSHVKKLVAGDELPIPLKPLLAIPCVELNLPEGV